MSSKLASPTPVAVYYRPFDFSLIQGFNKAIEWYSQHDADDRGEDALGIEQAERPRIYHGHEDEDEDLVVIMVTHGAGSNALIGALTNQPVLLDVGI